MKFISTAIDDAIIIEPDVFGDERGFFMETWHKDKFSENGIDINFVQDNHSRSEQGTLRGLHYQIESPQGKLIRVISGEIYDVAVDLRQSSPTFGKWIGEYLTAKNKKMLWVPIGFAHGFYVISAATEVVYKCTDVYKPEYERSLIWNDPKLNINWPLVNGNPPLLSKKDAAADNFKDAEYY